MLPESLYNGLYRPSSLTNVVGNQLKMPATESNLYTGTPVTSNQLGTGPTMNNATLNRLGITPENLSAGYVDNLQMGADGNVYDVGLSSKINGSIPPNGLNIGPTKANADETAGNDGSWDYNDWGTAGDIGLGVGQLGLGIMSYLDRSKTADKQRRLLDQQYANNADLISARKAKRTNISQAFGG